MSKYLYFSLMPQALIASMLSPVEFGKYMTGTRGRMAPSGQQSIFFEVDLELVKKVPYFDFEGLEDELIQHPDGTPKNSVHISQYRVLEHLPLESFLSLYLTTSNGQVLELKKSLLAPDKLDRSYFLYQLLSPRAVMIAAKMSPELFIEAFTSKPINRISFPKICLVDLHIGLLANNPESEQTGDLPYRGLSNLKNCLKSLKEDKPTKMVDRDSSNIYWRMIKSGFYVGDGKNIIFYQFPSPPELISTYYEWHRHAQND